MQIRNIPMFFLAWLLLPVVIMAQQPKIVNDTAKVYKKLEDYSKQSKFRKALYQLVFKSETLKSKKKIPKKKTARNLKQRPYSAFEGKIIRNIQIITLDPFGYSISDTLTTDKGFLARTGNRMHIKSQHITIRNLLLFKQNQVFDSLLVKESERLVRKRAYVQDVSFYCQLLSKNSDSVDVFIRELDNWSILPILITSTTNVNLKLSDRNFLGMGHESQNGLSWYVKDGKFAYFNNYLISNIRNTYINAALLTNTNEKGDYSRSFIIARPFFSPFAKWAAGLNLNQTFRKDSIRGLDSLFIPAKIKVNSQDYWAGHSHQIFKGNSENNRTTNLITSAAYLRIRYLQHPPAEIDTLLIYSNEDFYMGSVGISRRKYVEEKFIFKYGVTEDVPVGRVYSLSVGYQKKPDKSRLYIGARMSQGSYYPWGYLSAEVQYGSFIHKSKAEQGILGIDINYFTSLLEIGKWKFRQFVKLQSTLGFHRFSYDTLTLNDGKGIDGFTSNNLSGSSRLLLTFQSQSYSPLNFYGFRFGPYLSCSFGMLGHERKGFTDSKLYTQIGLGVLIKNERLIVSTFQISISFYPVIPGSGINVLKINSFKTTDFGFKDFEIGKPAIIPFQ